MALISKDKQEYLSEDASCAVVCLTIKFLGIPLYRDVYATQNLSYLSYFDKERFDALSSEEEGSNLYTKTSIGFTAPKDTTNTD